MHGLLVSVVLRRRFPLWVACLAILWATLVPTADLLASTAVDTGLPWQDVCSAMRAPSTSTAADSQPDDGESPRHCPWCKLHVAVVIPSASTDFLRIDADGHVADRACAQSPLRGAAPYRLAAPRGPPAFF